MHYYIMTICLKELVHLSIFMTSITTKEMTMSKETKGHAFPQEQKQTEVKLEFVFGFISFIHAFSHLHTNPYYNDLCFKADICIAQQKWNNVVSFLLA